MSKIIRQTSKNIKKDNYATPKIIYEQFIKQNYYDPCPLNDNYIINALTTSWKEKAFINPPFSNILKFVDKAFIEFQYGKLKEFYFLVPSHTGTKWFKKLVNSNFCESITFFTNRLKFNDGKNGATFDCCIIKNSYGIKEKIKIDFVRYEEYILK